MIFSDHRRLRGYGDYGFTAAELQAWADLAVTDPKLAAQLVKDSVTPLPKPAISCPQHYIYDQASGACHLLPEKSSSGLLIFGALAAGFLIMGGGK